MNKPIEVIATHDEEGHVRPYRFRLETDESSKLTFQVSRIIDKREEKRMGTTYLIFICRVDHASKDFELKFDKMNCKWYMGKLI